MISLRNNLTDTIAANGKTYKIVTGYREWLGYPDAVTALQHGDSTAIIKYYPDNRPWITAELLDAMTAFYHTPPEIPRVSGGDRILDYDIDADYIYAAFLQAYGIDLISDNIHWHRFQALLNALPDTTMLAKIMQYRSYEGNSNDPGYKDYMDLRKMWELPVQYSEDELAALDRFNQL